MIKVFDETNTFSKKKIKEIKDLSDDFFTLADGIDPQIVFIVVMNMAARIAAFYEMDQFEVLKGFALCLDRNIQAIVEKDKEKND